MKGIIDRFEGDYAVVEFDGRQIKDVPKIDISPEAKEGDVIILAGKKFYVDAEETKKRKDEIAKLTKNIWE